MNTFNEIYSMEVDRKIRSGSTDNFIYEGRKWYIRQIYGHKIAMSKSRFYSVPPGIVGLLRMRTINKLYADTITVSLDLSLNWCPLGFAKYRGRCWFSDYCSQCAKNTQNFLNVHSSENETICIYCYVDSENRDNFTRLHITDFNASDWVPFMKSLHTVYCVNCNVDSDEYGLILKYAGHAIDLIGTIDQFLSGLHKWIPHDECYSKPDVGHITCILEDPAYFPAVYPMNEIYGYPKEVTRRYILEHQNDLMVYSDEIVNRYVEFVNEMGGRCPFTREIIPADKLLEHAQNFVQQNEGKKIIIDRYIVDINMRIDRAQKYRDMNLLAFTGKQFDCEKK